ncbi:hypothetical protein IFR05_001420 [Cadophora sp. M221]|nr:hypothetical protein IFR05_001420 [Cadophora sp. M221]
MEDALENTGDQNQADSGAGGGVRLRGGKRKKAKKAARKEAKLATESAKESKARLKKPANDEASDMKVPYWTPVATKEEKEEAKRVAREGHANSILRNIAKFEKKLAELSYADDEDPSIKNRRYKLLERLAKQRKNLGPLENLGALDSKERFGTHVGPLEQDDLEQEDEEAPDGDHIPRSKKRKISGFVLGEEDYEGISEETAAREVIIIDETPKKIKKEKKDKKRKIDNSSQDSSELLDSIPAFEHESAEPTNIEQFDSNKTAGETNQYAMQDVPVPPTSEQAKQSALLGTIARSRSRSESIGGDRIYQALLASMREPPSPPSPMSSIGDNYRPLIEVGQSAIAAPILPNSQKPVRDRAFTAQAPASKKDLTVAPRESPILPPKRIFSSARVVPAVKEASVENTKSEKIKPEKTKSKKKDVEGSKKSRKSASSKPAEDSQESATLSQTVTALKESASATVIEGIFAQADPFNIKNRILPPAKPSIPKPLIHSSTTDSSSLAATPTPKPRPGKRVESEFEEWELASGRLRARVDKQGTTDDGEVEENIAFSSTYLRARPHGINISGTTFQTLHVPSTKQDLPISTAKESLTICSVAKGRVTVSLGREKFNIGEGGMWRPHSPESSLLLFQQVLAKTAISDAPILWPTEHERLKRDVPKDSLLTVTWAWLLNVAGILLSAAILVAIIVILRNYDGQMQPDWNYSFNLNSLVAILTTVLRTALMDTVSDSMSQLKWSWFSKPRKLGDLQKFDEGSRGPWGSLKLFVNIHRPHPVLLGAAVTVLSSGTGTFAQQTILSVSCVIDEPGSNSTILSDNLSHPEMSFESVQVRNCTFKSHDGITHSSIGLCTRCVNISSSIFEIHDDESGNYNFTLPNGLSIGTWSHFGGDPYINMSWVSADYGPSSAKYTGIGNVTILQFTGAGAGCYTNLTAPSTIEISCPNGENFPKLPHLDASLSVMAAHCSYEVCLKNFAARVVAGVVEESLVSTAPANF